jgi:hypothetical protein
MTTTLTTAPKPLPVSVEGLLMTVGMALHPLPPYDLFHIHVY